MSKELIFDYAERQKRIEHKKQSLLTWLVDFTWTTPEIAGQVMGLSTRAGINKTLKRLRSEELIKESSITLADNRGLRVIGITPNGLLWCDNHPNAAGKTSFDPKRVAQSTIIHRLDVQRCRIKIGASGTKWIAENNYPESIVYRPDAILRVGDSSVALELERTAKTRKRYQNIITQHLRQIHNGSYQYVHYVSTVPGFARRLERLFSSITKLPVRGQQVLFSDDLRGRFKFYDFNEWRFD
jgi:hypothetical protein